MASVTNIKTISNALVYPVTIKNGENTQQTFTIGANSGWNGDLWVPWVGNDGEMWKCIMITCPDQDNMTIQLFQDYWNPPNANATKRVYVSRGESGYGAGREIFGENRGGGEKALMIASDTTLTMR